jgi:hypothetical protein
MLLRTANMEDYPVKFWIGVMAAALAGCASTDYEPVQERSFAQLLSDGCDEQGQQMLVTGQVSRAYQDTVVLWDGIDPQATVAVSLPGGVTQRVRGWFGKNKREVTERTLNDLASRNVPVTVGLECQGNNVAPVARSISYTDQRGQRVAIAY